MKVTLITAGLILTVPIWMFPFALYAIWRGIHELVQEWLDT